MFNMEANPAPTNDPIVVPKLFIDMKRANNVPSIPGGHSCPDKIRNGINLQFYYQEENQKMNRNLELSEKTKMRSSDKLELIDSINKSRAKEHHNPIWYSKGNIFPRHNSNLQKIQEGQTNMGPPVIIIRKY
jgi:hypothetical protein